jgi:uncharacterized protein (TIGR02466 family)
VHRFILDDQAMNEPQIEQIDLWNTHLFATYYPEHDLSKQALLDFFIKYQNKASEAIASQVAVIAKHQLFESKLTLMDEEDPDIQMLRSSVEELIAEVATAINEPYWPEGAEAQASVIESWFHITENGGYHDVHSHPNCSWCGIYYVEAADSNLEDRNGVNRFYDPRQGADHYQDAGTAYLGAHGVQDFAPTEGQIIIFPSYLKHSALAYFGSTNRVVVAFNAVVNIS